MTIATDTSGGHAGVLAAVDAYCRGVYLGDVVLLRTVFDARAQLFAQVRGQPYYRPLEEYLAVVAARQSPAALGEPFRMKPISIEVANDIAFAKVQCPIFEFNYLDYLTFVRQAGQWKIVNKTFIDLPEAGAFP